MEISEELKKCFPAVQENVILKDYSTFRIGGPAKYFFSPTNKIELKSAIEKAIELGIDWKILGGGSNTLIDSNGFDGLVILLKNNPAKEDFNFTKQADGSCRAEVIACWPLFFLISQSVENDLSGMEWAIGIPGTIGGAINGNAGAYNQEIAEQVEGVEALQIKNDFVAERYFTKEDCKFGYRDSIFKNDPSLIILSAKIGLKQGDPQKIKERIKENMEKRNAKQPRGFSVGSVFKNYTGSVSEEISDQYPQIRIFMEKGSISAGYLIEQCGLKGVNVGGAMISNEHANFIINHNNASSGDVLALIDLIKKEVRNKFGLELREEIKIF
jgi:UDP-N-acetylmuramate dehydrogenase